MNHTYFNEPYRRNCKFGALKALLCGTRDAVGDPKWVPMSGKIAVVMLPFLLQDILDARF